MPFGVFGSTNTGCLHVIRDRHTGLYVRLIDSDESEADYDIELVSDVNKATTIGGWGYTLAAAKALDMPFVIERLTY